MHMPQKIGRGSLNVPRRNDLLTPELLHRPLLQRAGPVLQTHRHDRRLLAGLGFSHGKACQLPEARVRKLRSPLRSLRFWRARRAGGCAP